MRARIEIVKTIRPLPELFARGQTEWDSMPLGLANKLLYKWLLIFQTAENSDLFE